MRILALLLALAGLFLLYYGGVMLFVPGYPGEPYLSAGRVGLGVVPALAGVGLLAVAAVLCLRPKRELAP